LPFSYLKLTYSFRPVISLSFLASLPTNKHNLPQDRLPALRSKMLSPPVIPAACAKSKRYGFNKSIPKSRSRSKHLHFKLSTPPVKLEYLLRSSLLR
jgi:hypothetical protein